MKRFRSSRKLLHKFVRCLFLEGLLHTEQFLVGMQKLQNFLTSSSVLLIVSHVSSGLLYVGLAGSVTLLASFPRCHAICPSQRFPGQV